jgi:hypothetical protein
MSAPTKTAKSSDLDRIFLNSKLDYSIPDTTVIVNQRRTVEIKPSQDTYSAGDVLRIDFSSEHDYVYGPNCYLMFDVTANAQDIELDQSVKGSLCNCLSEIKITAKSIQLEHTRGLNTLVHMKDHFACNQGYLSHTGTLMGYDDGNITAGQKRKALIPLHHISSFFSQDKYIPLPELGIVTMEFTLAPNNKSFVFAAAGGTYTVDNVRLVLDSYTMAEAVLRKGQKLAASGRLILSYDTYDYNNSSVTAATSNSVEFKRSVAKALSVYSRVKLTSNDVVSENSLVGKAFNGSTYQYRVGSEFHPLVPVSDGKQAFFETLKAWGNSSNCVRPPTVSSNTFGTSHSTLAVELERDIALDGMMSGISSKDGNRVILEVNPGLAPAAGSLYVESWLHFLQVCIVHTDSIMVKS